MANCVFILGRLTRDAELRYASNTEMAILRFNIAVDRRLSKEKRTEAENNNQPTADFINCIAFGKTAEIIGQYFGKGNKIAITGHIQTGSYEKDGQRIYTTDVVVDSFDFVESNSSSTKTNQENTAQDYGFNQAIPTSNNDLPF